MTSFFNKPVNRDILIGVALLAILCLLPWLGLKMYWLRLLIIFFMYGTIVSQWNLVMGIGGIFSLGQMAIFAMGAYTTAWLAKYAEWSLWASWPVGIVFAVIASLIIGAACLRVSGVYTALLTLAIVSVMQLLIQTDTACFRPMKTGGCDYFTGGSMSLSKYGDLGMRDWLGRKDWIKGDYYIGLAMLSMAIAFSIFIVRSPMGIAFKALRDNPLYAVSRGVSRFKYQMLIFSASSLFTGMAGGFYAAHYGATGATILNLNLLLLLMAMMIVGGLGRLWGPILGVGVLMALQEPLRDIIDYRELIFGFLILIFAMFYPQGIAGFLEYVCKRVTAVLGSSK
jgi:branched-chain amino acid transport system permease protein